MTVATSIRTALRTLINQFGNSISVYDYSGATTSEDSEGDVTVSDWGTAVSAYCVDGNSEIMQNLYAEQGIERIGNDEIVIRDNVTIDAKDRIDRNSISYKVVSIRPIRIQSTTVAQIVTIEVVNATSPWS